MKRCFRAPLLLMPLVMVLWTTCPSPQAQPYHPIKGPCGFTFPRDHGAHPGFRTEWWYYTGNVRTLQGDPYGFQLTFFRLQINPSGAEKEWPPSPSAWRTRNLYAAHTALSDIEGRSFSFHEALSREALGLAGVRPQGDGICVFLDRWHACIGPRAHLLKADTQDFSFELRCIPLKPVTAHGAGGYSLKGRNPQSASCYYSLTRLRTSGTLNKRGKTMTVRGSAWMDHEYSTAPLEKDLCGWDWFSLQLEDKTELMLYLLREVEGGISPASSGTFVDRSGISHPLQRKDMHVDFLERWESSRSGAVYPCRWRIRVDPLGLDLTVTANLKDQELVTPNSTRITYWEGSVSAHGRVADGPVKGRGYVEMTGYARPFHGALGMAAVNQKDSLR